MHMLRKEPGSHNRPNASPSPSSSPQLQSSPFSSPVKTCRLMKNVGREDVAHGQTPPYTPPTGLMMNSTGREDVQTANTPPSSYNAGRDYRFSPELFALGELEFRKAFLILNYIGKEKLEDKIKAHQIRQWKDLPMEKFEDEVWFSLVLQGVRPAERCKSEYWESGKTYLYHCHVDKDGSFTFKGPYLDKSRNHLQRVLGDDNVLFVKFGEGPEDTESKSSADNGCSPAYKKIGKDGILVGLRRYRFFVFKDGGKGRRKDRTSSAIKCIFVRFDSNAFIDDGKDYPLTGLTVRQARHMFMRVHTMPTVAKYMARFSLILSGTMKVEVDFADVNVKPIEDERCRDEDGNFVLKKDGDYRIHTDGTGFISEDLALLCPKDVFKGSIVNAGNVEGRHSPPLIIQCRLFHDGSAAKGTLVLNKRLPPRTILVRESMIKVEPEPDPKMPNACTKNSLEVVKTSNHPKRAYLSKYLIALLSYGGVPDDFFMDILKNALEESQAVFSNKRTAFKVALNHGGMDDFGAAKMILSGIPLDEPYLEHRLSILFNEERKGLLEGRLPVTDSYVLMGTVDPSGVLESDEVCIILDHGQISGKVLVYRHPGLHFGDVHLLNARYVEALNEFVGNAKYGIFFPCKGPRSLADEMAGGDFDGDTFFISRNPQLLEYFKPSEPWIENSPTCGVSRSSKEISELSDQELEDELFESFLTARFWPSHATGIAADSWMAIMDRFLTLEDVNSSEKELVKKNLLALVDIYYEALDAAKAGKEVEVPPRLKPDVFPHYMERKSSFQSTSILGKIYDFVKAYRQESSKEIQKLPCFDVGFSNESGKKWTELYGEYKRDMHFALCGENKEVAPDEVYNKYKQKLYGADESEKPEDHIYDEAIAIYNISYDSAWRDDNNVGKCGFAWKVAGSALLKLYASKQGEEPLPCNPTVMKELFT